MVVSLAPVREPSQCQRMCGMSVQGDGISVVHGLDIDDVNTAGMSVHGGVHDLDMDSDNPSDEDDAIGDFEFLEANNKTVVE